MTKERVLALLRQRSGYLSGEAISAELGVSRAGVWKAIRRLRAEGYEILAKTNCGYRLESLPDVLSAAEIANLAALGQDRVRVFSSIDSTNNAARRLAQEGAPAGTAVISDTQTGGRGRRGRSFFSPPGCGIYLSVILRPQALPEDVMNLTALAAVAACDAIERVSAVRPKIKWTNDLVLGGKKLGGILTELSLVAETREIDYAVLGIGINVKKTHFPPEIAQIACDLSTFSGKKISRNLLCAELLRAFSELSRQLPGENSARMARYRRDCLNIGKAVKILRGDTAQEAECLDVLNDGALLVRYADGTEEKISSGEVTIRGLYGYL